MNKNRVTAIIILIIITITGGVLFWKMGRSPKTVAQANGRQEAYQATAYGSNALVAWVDYRDGNADIYAQQINDNSQLLWKSGGIPIAIGKNNQWHIKLTSDSKKAYISWVENKKGQDDLWLQGIDTNGLTTWKTPVNVAGGPGDQNNQFLLAEKDGVSVVWTDFSTGRGQVRVQRYDDKGKPLWRESLYVSKDQEQQLQPEIIRLNQDESAVIWQQQTADLNPDIHAQKIDEAGNRRWGDTGVPVMTGELIQKDASSVADGSGGLYVAWEDNRSQPDNIFAQHLNSEGERQWDSEGIAVIVPRRVRWHPRAFIQSGRLTVVWKEQKNEDDVYAQQFSIQGERLWGENGKALSAAQKDQAFINSLPLAKNRFAAVWQDKRSGSDKIYAEVVNEKERRLWGEDGKLIYGEDGSQQIDPQIVPFGKDKMLIVWEREDGKESKIMFAVVPTVK